MDVPIFFCSSNSVYNLYIRHFDDVKIHLPNCLRTPNMDILFELRVDNSTQTTQRSLAQTRSVWRLTASSSMACDGLWLDMTGLLDGFFSTSLKHEANFVYHCRHHLWIKIMEGSQKWINMKGLWGFHTKNPSKFVNQQSARVGNCFDPKATGFPFTFHDISAFANRTFLAPSPPASGKPSIHGTPLEPHWNRGSTGKISCAQHPCHATSHQAFQPGALGRSWKYGWLNTSWTFLTMYRVFFPLRPPFIMGLNMK